ncbi:MAG: hypothetical protein FOGNACKC_02633 [Anaerolineae bacterium]|nr:hypothetical protein [Anaerolineae bacterium]
MPKAMVSIELDAPCDVVFNVIHNYDCRLEWDSMLREARLLGGATAAGTGVRSRCVGTWRSAFLALETEYVRFEPGQVAAVKLTNRPPFFEEFAATIRHTALDAGRSRARYIYFFRARPRFLAPFLEPLMNTLLRREVHLRLRSLRRYLASRAA